MQVITSLFPKFLNTLTIPELAAVVGRVGLNTTNVIIRDTLIFMPFYHETEPAALIEVLTREVSYLRDVRDAMAENANA